MRYRLLLLLGLVLPVPGAAVAAQAQPDPPALLVERAEHLWDAGDYPAALELLARLLRSPQDDSILKAIALLTGEWYTTTLLASDGRNLRISGDGQYGAWETGSGSATKLTVVSLADGATVAELPGRGLAFAPEGRAAAFLRIVETPALSEARARQAAAVAGGARGEILAANQEVARQELAASRVHLLDLRTGQTAPVDHPPIAQPLVSWAPDGRALWLTTSRPDQPGTQLTRVSFDGPPSSLGAPGEVWNNPVIAAGGLWLVHSIGASTVGVRGLVTGSHRRLPGRTWQVASNGTALVALGGVDGGHTVWVLSLEREDAEPEVIFETARRIENPAISTDGRRVAFSVMYEDDWELAVAELDGTGVRRLTREIQHDRFPRFLDGDRILSVMGEGRHRRSYLHDFTTGARERLFHNNTVRTIAPEYEWARSDDGSLLLVSADRDGDTVSPERGVYLMDLTRPVSQDELLARVEANLAAERELRSRAAELFRPIAPLVQRLTDSVSITRLYGYQRALAQWSSRHMTQPGANLAGAWLAETLLSFGYAPEYQWFQPPVLAQHGLETANIVAVLPGTTHPDLVYVLGSHYDSVEPGPGADDNASGTAVLLEAARVLAQHPLPATVIFVAFAAEESGLLGAFEFTRRAAEDGLDVRGAINNDMIGWANDHRLDNTIRYSNAGIREVQHAAALGFSKLITYDSRYYQSTDADPMFRAWGDVVGGIGSYPVLGNPHYHQATDRLNTINQQLVMETAKATVAALTYLASSPSPVRGLRLARQGTGATVSWQPSAEKDIASYTVRWGLPGEPPRGSVMVRGTSHTILNLPEDAEVSVRATNTRGLAGWDWARVRSEP
jgi:aminopeptidase YwaD